MKKHAKMQRNNRLILYFVSSAGLVDGFFVPGAVARGVCEVCEPLGRVAEKVAFCVLGFCCSW